MISTPDIVMTVKGKWDIHYYWKTYIMLKKLEKKGSVSKVFVDGKNFWKGSLIKHEENK